MAAKSDRHIMSQKLDEAERNIKSSNPAKGRIPKDIQRLQPSEDAGKIKYFPIVRCQCFFYINKFPCSLALTLLC